MRRLRSALILAVAMAALVPAGHTQTNTPDSSDVPYAALRKELAAELDKFKTADELWAHIEDLKGGPKRTPVTQDVAVAMFRRAVWGEELAAAEFIRRYPDDARQWDARLLRVELASPIAQLGGDAPDTRGQEKALREIVDAPAARLSTKADARFTLIQLLMNDLPDDPSTNQWSAVEKEIAAFRQLHTNDTRADKLQMQLAVVLENVLPSRSDTLWNDLTGSADADVAAQAKAHARVREELSRPLTLKFKADDGREVDLTALRGKVVLLDFWATWCPPCRRSIPELVAVFGKQHDKGFEIVGVSLDESRDAMQAMTKKAGMTWPQFFDGKAWASGVASRFNIHAIPAMWLIDKRGYAHRLDAGKNLDDEVAKLLAE